MPSVYRFPPIERSRMASGLTVLWVEHREQPALEVALQVPAGRFSDPRGKEGTAELAIALLQSGCRRLSPSAFSGAIEQAGASLFHEVGDEHVCMGMRVLAAQAEEVVPLFWEMIADPGLDNKEFLRLKRELITSTRTETIDPGSLCERQFYRELYGDESPPGRLHTPASAARITRDDIVDYLRRFFGPRDAAALVIGDFTSRARAAWERQLSAWQAAGAAAPGVRGRTEPLARTGIRLVVKNDLSQTSLALGHEGPGELSDEKEAAALANHILGGGFSSRLVSRVRSEEGSTYGIGSHLGLSRLFGTFWISTSTQTGQTGDVLRAVLDVYRRFGTEGVTNDELEKAKQYAAGSMAFQLEGIGNISEKLLWLSFYGREPSYIEDFPGRIAALRLDQVNDAIRRLFASKHFAIAAAGPRASTLPQLREFGEVKLIAGNKPW